MMYFVGDTILLTRLSILSSAFHLFHQYLRFQEVFATHATGSRKGMKRYVKTVQNYKSISLLFGHRTASNWLPSATSQMCKAPWRL